VAAAVPGHQGTVTRAQALRLFLVRATTKRGEERKRERERERERKRERGCP